MNERRVPHARFFDAHCDTIQKVVENGADFAAHEGMHVTLPGMLEAGMCAQVFAAWALAEQLKPDLPPAPLAPDPGAPAGPGSDAPSGGAPSGVAPTWPDPASEGLAFPFPAPPQEIIG